MIQSYKDLIVWQKSMDLVEEIYFITGQFPKEEIFGLTSQMRRAAVSIPSNIAEGRTRSYKKEYVQFLLTAYASGAELETQILLSKRLHKNKKIDYNKADNLLTEVMKMLNVLIYKLRSD